MASQTQLLELKPDINLLNSNFDGYKLSLKRTNFIRHELESPIHRILLDPRQYSFLHAKIFGLNNFLVGETSDSYENVYFVDQHRHLNKANFSTYTNTLKISKVWTIPTNEAATQCVVKYNVSLKLLSENLAVLSDGTGAFFLLNTGHRGIECEWQTIYFSNQLYECKSFYIQDAVLKGTELHVLLCMIQQGDKKAQLNTHWVTFSNETDSLIKLSTRKF
ncbi:hypothetical protein HHI36_008146 [Cryptolaemus montrouzieri]|uniref:Uncharacterized protein n=1 Tax=Cryptolaemus montrouzieri TaxID=559131 RepID=A0ABD2MRV6_9CUCU